MFFSRSDPFFSRGGHGTLFDDLDGFHSHTTTFSNGNGNTIHITRTVIGEDGSVRREMRFRSPNSSSSEATKRPTNKEQFWDAPKRPTARVSPNVKPTGNGTTTNNESANSEARGQPDGASAAAPDITNINTPSKPPPNTTTHRRPQVGGGASPRYASPTQSSNSRSRGTGVGSSSPSRTPSTNNASNNVRVQPTQRGPVSSRPRAGATRRRPHNNSDHGGPQPKHLIQCPLCSRSFEKHVIELHAANCEGKPEDVPEVVTIPDDEPTSGPTNRSNKVECPICNQAYDQSEIEAHAANCGEEVYV